MPEKMAAPSVNNDVDDRYAEIVGSLFALFDRQRNEIERRIIQCRNVKNARREVATERADRHAGSNVSFLLHLWLVTYWLRSCCWCSKPSKSLLPLTTVHLP